MYLVGLLVAILVALVVHKTSKDGAEEPLLIELPEYKTPTPGRWPSTCGTR